MTTNQGAVVVTGASKGIGTAIARRLANAGFRVYAGVRREADAPPGPRIQPIRIDVTDEATIRVAAAEIADREPAGLAGLVNNAGIAIAAPLEFLPLDDLRRQLEVNVIGQLAVIQAFLPQLRQARGRIVNMGSIGDRIVTPMVGPYQLSKWALAAMNDGLRLELRQFGIEVILIEPGAIATPMWQTTIHAANDLASRLPAQVDNLYGPLIANARAYAIRSEANGAPADLVAKTVLTALTARRPKTRYLVGRDAKFASWIARLPDRLKDQLLLRDMAGVSPAAATA